MPMLHAISKHQRSDRIMSSAPNMRRQQFRSCGEIKMTGLLKSCGICESECLPRD